MAVHFHPLTVKKVQKETSDCVVVSFDVPATLQALFKYAAGQNITLKKTIDGEELRRSYSICSAPFENTLSVAIKKLPTGKFSTYANEQLKKGDVLDILPPTGKFSTPLNPVSRKRYLAFAAGSGITPIISIIKNTLSTEPESSFTLVYGNRSRKSIVFFDALAGIKNQYTDRFNIIHILSREQTEASLNSGRIDAEKLAELKRIINYTIMDGIFICGPQDMIFVAKGFLEAQGIDPHKIHFELFTTPGSRQPVHYTPDKIETGQAKSKISIQLDGRIFDFDLAYSGESILDAALKQGADLPYACKGGICCTCRARLITGKVKMDANYALEAEELSKGFILTCQSHPLTEKIMVDFDSR